MLFGQREQSFFQGNPDHFAMLKNAIEYNTIPLWNEWMREHTVFELDLRGINLSYLDLSGIDLSHADLSFSELCYTNLENARFYRSSLFYANLKGANILNADLRETDLSRANLQVVMCEGRELLKAKLTHAYIEDLYFVGQSIPETIIETK